jgi:hypothetical protein
VAVAVVTLVATAVVAAAAGTPNGQWWEFALLTAGAIGGGIFEVRIGPSSYISGIFVFSIIAAAFLGPLAAFLTPTIACVVSGLVHKARRIAILGTCAVADDVWKLGVRGRTAAVAEAMRRGLLD